MTAAAWLTVGLLGAAAGLLGILALGIRRHAALEWTPEEPEDDERWHA